MTHPPPPSRRRPKGEARRAAALERIADRLLERGLTGATLRDLSAAAGLSDRMLLYYFGSKEAAVEAGLMTAAGRLGGALASADDGGRRSAADLEAALLRRLAAPDLWPYMALWLEIAALAARGEAAHVRVGRQIALGFRAFLADRLAGPAAEADDRAAGVLRSLEGGLVLRAFGLEPEPPAAERRG